MPRSRTGLAARRAMPTGRATLGGSRRRAALRAPLPVPRMVTSTASWALREACLQAWRMAGGRASEERGDGRSREAGMAVPKEIERHQERPGRLSARGCRHRGRVARSTAPATTRAELQPAQAVALGHDQELGAAGLRSRRPRRFPRCPPGRLTSVVQIWATIYLTHLPQHSPASPMPQRELAAAEVEADLFGVDERPRAMDQGQSG